MRYLCIYHITLSIPLIHLQFYRRKRIPDWLKNFQKSPSTRIIFYLIRMESKKKKKREHWTRHNFSSKFLPKKDTLKRYF